MRGGRGEGGQWEIVALDDESLFRPAADALNAAFFDDPLLEFLAPDVERRRHLIALVYPFHIRLAMPDGHVYVARATDGAKEVAGTILLSPPGRYPIPMRRIARQVPSFVSGLGELLPSLGSMLPGFRYLRSAGRLHVKGIHWYVMAVGVAPEHQGLGAGRALLTRAIELALGDGLPLYLETENEDNLGFYEHLGFRVIGEAHPHRAGPKLYGLLNGGNVE